MKEKRASGLFLTLTLKIDKSYLLHTFNNIPMATNKPGGNSSHGQKVHRNCLEIIRNVEEVLNRKYVVKMCDTACPTTK